VTLKELMRISFNMGRESTTIGQFPSFELWWENDGKDRHDAFTADAGPAVELLRELLMYGVVRGASIEVSLDAYKHIPKDGPRFIFQDWWERTEALLDPPDDVE